MKKRKLAILLAFALFFSSVNLGAVETNASTTSKSKYDLYNPTVSSYGVGIWNCITFGNYYQSSEQTKEPIKWRVLSVNDDKALLLADNILDLIPYSHAPEADILWNNCSLRVWMNDVFLNNAFNDTEKSALVLSENKNIDSHYGGGLTYDNTYDRVFLLASDDVEKASYGFWTNDKATLSRVAFMTPYCAGKAGVTSNTKTTPSWWGLRSPGFSIGNPGTCRVATVRVDGSCDYTGVRTGSRVENNGAGDQTVTPSMPIRPAILIDLSKGGWTKVDSVTSDDYKSMDLPKVTATPTVSAKPLPFDQVKSVTGWRIKSNRALVSWKGICERSDYEVQYSLKKNFKKKMTKMVYGRSAATLKKLQKDKSYYVRVRAAEINVDGKKYGKWSNTIKVNTKVESTFKDCNKLVLTSKIFVANGNQYKLSELSKDTSSKFSSLAEKVNGKKVKWSVLGGKVVINKNTLKVKKNGLSFLVAKNKNCAYIIPVSSNKKTMSMDTSKLSEASTMKIVSSTYYGKSIVVNDRKDIQKLCKLANALKYKFNYKRTLHMSVGWTYRATLYTKKNKLLGGIDPRLLWDGDRAYSCSYSKEMDDFVLELFEKYYTE